ncbi:preprotein translocase subunit SecG [Marichromatium purpuratum 984]|uniref:Protein-export membrane protein SecG n=1 Tax=Marichromatium purpuratum 984 TaxID=765910 RepID=W0E122_MARPU|nr:preprotein translocase subunit SecG [Marichromatium purpuratum]AHF03198.1 preprotein translocase subunit SecG [Marichromatium purpuratum 984]
MQTILTIVQVFLSLGLIGLVLIQHGKGADAGAAFGSGASQTVFGSQGSGSFLTRATAIFATLFFLTSMALAYFATQVGEPEGFMEDMDDAVLIEAAPETLVPSDVPSVPGVDSDDSATQGAPDVPAMPTAEVSVDSDENSDNVVGHADGQADGSSVEFGKSE